jgi:serine/threonine protein kinase
MSSTTDRDTLLDVVRKSGLVEEDALTAHLSSSSAPEDPTALLESLVEAGLLTRFQVWHLTRGKHKGFFLGPYKVLEPLGKGGMGLVYLAEHAESQRRVAIKVLPAEFREEDGVQERFWREGRIGAALDHPNIVRFHDRCREGDVDFLVMELVEGKSLQEILNARGRLPFRTAVGYVLQAAQGLAHAHERGVVHRDIKPGNLIVDHRGIVKILDLGLARFFDDRSDNLTERLGTSGLLGSPDYIAPEQALGQLDTRSDIYSLGVTLYTLINGRPPFRGKTISQKLLAHQSHQVVSLRHLDSRVPEEVSQIVLRMMARNPFNRCQTPAEVIAALTPWGPIPEPTTHPAPAPVLPAPRSRPPGRLLTTAIVATVLAIVVGLGAGWWVTSGSRSSSGSPGAHLPAPTASTSGTVPSDVSGH